MCSLYSSFLGMIFSGMFGVVLGICCLGLRLKYLGFSLFGGIMV